MAKDYTAYHLYAERQYQEARNGNREPYTQSGYDCPHSQRAFLGSYDHYGQRIQDDAAGVGNCCGEEIRLFENRKQFIELDDPTPSKDCSKLKKDVRCADFKIGDLDWESVCASGTGRLNSIKTYCHTICYDDLLQLPSSGKVPMTEGSWIYRGQSSDVDMVSDYEIHDTVMSDVYDNCSGPYYINETYCNDQVLSLIVNGDLGSTGGCGCDCCGTNGSFAAPVGVITPPSGVTASYANTVTLGSVENSPACSGGTLTGNFASTPYGAQGAISYGSYVGSGSTVRKIYATSATVGASGYPACCGGVVTWSGSNGCATGSNPSNQTTTITVGYAGTPTLSITDGVVNGDGSLVMADTYDFQVSNSCPSSSHRSIEFTETCLQGADAGYYSSGFNMKRRTAPLIATSTYACKKCCSAGQLQVDWDNGCNVTGQTIYSVKNPQSSGIRGAELKCVDSYGLYTPTWQTVSCDGTGGGSWTAFGAIQATMANCVARIDAATDTDVTTLASSGLLVSDCGTCAHYTNNGLTLGSFRAHIFCINNTGWSSSPICCDELYTSGAAWINQSSSYCCP